MISITQCSFSRYRLDTVSRIELHASDALDALDADSLCVPWLSYGTRNDDAALLPWPDASFLPLTEHCQYANKPDPRVASIANTRTSASIGNSS